MAKIRTFVAVDVSAKVQAGIAKLIERLALTGIDYKWVDRENLHITLNFLGEVDEKEVPEVCRCVQSAVVDFPSFEITLSGLGSFPSANKPKVVWVGSEMGQEHLSELNDRIAAKLEAMRFPRDRNAFHAHLTLGRLRRGGRWNQSFTDSLKKFADFDGGQCIIDQVVVYSSFLDRLGPTYTPMATIKLS